MPKGSFVFDSHALLKFFAEGKGDERVLHLLEEIKKTGATKYTNAMNFGKIIYATKRDFNDLKKTEVLALGLDELLGVIFLLFYGSLDQFRAVSLDEDPFHIYERHPFAAELAHLLSFPFIFLDVIFD